MGHELRRVEEMEQTCQIKNLCVLRAAELEGQGCSILNENNNKIFIFAV